MDMNNKLNITIILKAMKILPPFLVMLVLCQTDVQAAPQEAALAGAVDPGVQMARAREEMEQQRVAERIKEDEATRKEQVQGGQEAKPQATEADVTFVLKKIELDPSTVLRSEEIDALVNPYLGQQVTIKDLYKIVDNINNTYIKKEYMTCRAFLPPQTIHDGVVQIKLVEGRTGTVKVEGNKSTLTRYITDRFPLQEGQIANTGQLNRSLQRFNGTNDMALRIKMQAGTKPDTTDYVLYAFEPNVHNVTLYTDNNGYETSGRYRYGLFYNWRSISGIRDNLRLSYIRTKGSGAYSLGYSVPVSKQGMKLDLDYTGNRNEVNKGDLRPLGVEGKASAYSAGLRYPLVVNSDKRYELGFQYLHQKSETTLGHGQVTWLDDKLDRYNLYAAFTNYGKASVFYHRYGMMYSNKKSMDGKGEHVNLYQINMFWRKNLPHRTAVLTRFSSQLAGKSYLSTANRFYIGGMSTVRGYEESFLSGDRGFALGTEYHFPLMEKYLYGLVFFDYGRVSGGYVISGADTLMSTGLGVAWEQNDLKANLILGKPLKKDVGGKKVDSLRVQFSLSKTF